MGLKEKEMAKTKKRDRLIDRVTTERLDMVLQMTAISIPYHIVDKIIDLVELLEDKGGKVNVNDICELQSEWKN